MRERPLQMFPADRFVSACVGGLRSHCYAPWPVVEAEVRDVLARNNAHPGHVFNLGHGVQPEMDPAVLERVVDLVHREGRVEPLEG